MLQLKVEPENDLCRCCHAESSSYKNVYEPYSWLDVEVVYSKLLRECFEVELAPVTQCLRHSLCSICDSCIEKLQDATHFKRQVVVCETRYRDFYRNTVLGETSSVVKQEIDMDLKGDSCRCCHAEGALKNLYEPHFSWIDGEEEIYSKLLLECFGIEMAPVSQSAEPIAAICDPCVERLQEADRFKRQIITCEKRFRVIHGSSIAGETPSEVKVKTEVEVKVTRLDEAVEIEIKPCPATSGSLSGDHVDPVDDPPSIVPDVVLPTRPKPNPEPNAKPKVDSEEKRKERKKRLQEQKRAKLAAMTEQEKEEFKRKKRERERARKNNMTKEEKEAYLKRKREYTRKREAKYREAKKEEINRRERERRKAKRANMGEEERERIRIQKREYGRAQRAKLKEKKLMDSSDKARQNLLRKFKLKGNLSGDYIGPLEELPPIVPDFVLPTRTMGSATAMNVMSRTIRSATAETTNRMSRPIDVATAGALNMMSRPIGSASAVPINRISRPIVYKLQATSMNIMSGPSGSTIAEPINIISVPICPPTAEVINTNNLINIISGEIGSATVETRNIMSRPISSRTPEPIKKMSRSALYGGSTTAEPIKKMSRSFGTTTVQPFNIMSQPIGSVIAEPKNILPRPIVSATVKPIKTRTRAIGSAIADANCIMQRSEQKPLKIGPCKSNPKLKVDYEEEEQVKSKELAKQTVVIKQEGTEP